MSPEKGPLQLWEENQRQMGNIPGAEIARTLREQFGDVWAPLDSEGGVKPDFEPEMLSLRRKDVVSRFVKAVIQKEAHLVKPSIYGLSLERWIRGKNILGSYLISSAKQEKIGQVYKIAQANVSFLMRNSIRYLWLSASPVVKEHFLLPHKPSGREIKIKQVKKKGLSRPLHPSSKQPVLPPESPIHPKLKEALSGVNFTFIAPESREVLRQVFSEGAHLLTPPGMNPERWTLYRNIFGTFILSKAKLGQIGKIYGISGERARQTNEIVLEKLNFQNKISLKKKPQYRPKEWLLVKDNLGSEIVELLEQGLSADQIKSRFEIGPKRIQAVKALKMLREMGFNIKRVKDSPGEYLRIAQKLMREDLTDEETQVLLDQINGARGIEVLRASGVIISVRDFLLSAGFHFPLFKQQHFYDALIDAGIPLGITESIVQSGPQKGKRYYFFIAARHKKRAEKALKENPDLERFLENPVKQISGPKTEIPNTTKIQKKNGVVSLASALTEFNISYKNRLKLQAIKDALIKASEIPIFQYDTTCYILESDLENVRAFIKSRVV